MIKLNASELYALKALADGYDIPDFVEYSVLDSLELKGMIDEEAVVTEEGLDYLDKYVGRLGDDE